MAGLGQLIVKLGLDAVDFVDGLSKSERQAQKFAARLGSHMQTAAAAAGTAFGVMIAKATAAIVVFDTLVKQAADFQDLAEMTGTSAEALASFAVSAATAGVEVSSVANSMNLLTKNLVGVDDESKAAGAALKALGLNVDEFKKLDPAAQYEAVGKALSGFADGAGKTAVAMALFGKSGAEQLKVFKALEEAGGRQIILTGEQIRQADEYADRQAKAKAELNAYAQAIATQALPALTALTGVLTEAAKEMLGVDSASKRLADGTGVKRFAEESALFLAKTVDVALNVSDAILLVGKSYAAAAAIVAAASRGDFGQIKQIIADARADGAKLFKNDFSDRLASQFDKLRANERLRAQEDRGFTPPGRQLPFQGAVKGDKAGKAAAERQTEAERYLEQLQRQLDKTRDLNVEETLLAELASGRLKISGNVTEQQLVDAARRIDQTKQEAKTLAERNAAMERTVAMQAAADSAAVAAADNLVKSNETLREEIELIGLDTEGRRALEQARLASTIALKEETLAGLQNAEASATQVASMEREIALLRERQGLLTKQARGEDLTKATAEADAFADRMNSNFADAFASFLDGTKSAKQAFKDFANDVIRENSRMVAKLLAESLFGKGQSSTWNGGGGGLLGGLFGSLSQSAGDFFGKSFNGTYGAQTQSGLDALVASVAGRASGGPVDANSLYRVNERSPELLDVSGKQFLMMGSQRGRVTPMASGRGGDTVIFNVTVPAGTTRETGLQMAAIANQHLAMGRRNM